MEMPRSFRILLPLSIDEIVGTQHAMLVYPGPQVLEETCVESLALIVLDPDVRREMSSGIQIRPLTVLSDVLAAALAVKASALAIVPDRA